MDMACDSGGNYKPGTGESGSWDVCRDL